MVFVSVILPLRLTWEPCYKTEAQLPVGTRVKVRFAHGEYVGVVHRTDVKPEVDASKVQEISCVDTGLAPVSAEELRLWEFIADYYLCTIGEVYKLASPLLKLRSEEAAVSAARRGEERAEATRIRMLNSLRSRVDRLEGRLDRKKAEIEKREQKGKESKRKTSLNVTETLKEEVVTLAAGLADARAAIARLSEEPARKTVLESATPVVKPDSGRTRLITGPGRYDFYCEQAGHTLSQGLDVLILVPEIAESEILERHLSKTFPTEILTCTSKATPAQRRKAAEKLKNGDRPYIVIGTRAALFLPFRKLGLVIVENEQELSYKQTEPSPRYNARDVALVLARIHGAGSILGAASPSLESLYNCLKGKYERIAGVPARQAGLTIIDICEERRKRGMRGFFSIKLIEEVRKAEGPTAFIRGWEKADDIQEEIEEYLPDTETAVLTYNEAKHTDLSHFAIVALIQADFLLGRNDFRCDERALQALSLLKEQPCDSLIVQTARSGHQLFSLEGAENLLLERKDFNMPPFSRIVDVTFHDSNSERMAVMSTRLKNKINPAMEIADRDSLTLRYIFPHSPELSSDKRNLLRAVQCLEHEARYSGHIIIDVDPS